MPFEYVVLSDGRRRVFITEPETAWTDPGDWNPYDNVVECVGRGGSSVASNYAGAGGGAYGIGYNIKPVFPVPIIFLPQANGQYTRFGPSPGLVRGQQGNTSTAAGGGAGGAIGFPFGFAGGSGETGSGGNRGGGGSGGPNGAGLPGAGSLGGAANAGILYQWDANHRLGNGTNSGQAGLPIDYGNGAGSGGLARGGPLIVVTWMPPASKVFPFATMLT